MLHIPVLATPFNSLHIPITGNTAASKGFPFRFSIADPEAGRKAYHAKRSQWSKLTLRQDFADESFMRDIIKGAGLRVPDRLEPATITRLRGRLRKAGIDGPEILTSLGTNLAGFLVLNPSLPLWAALALVLESAGRMPETVPTK
jgi:hypothetical protein